MVDVPVLGTTPARKITLNDDVFAARFHTGLVHECVRAERAARRRGTAATRTRGMVSGGGAKPWRQKGTGRARAGSSRSPLWTGGGTAFGPQPRSYTVKVNRRARRAALRSALSLHAQRGSLAVLDPQALPEPRTARARELIEGWSGGRPALVVVAAGETVPMLAFRNLANVRALRDEDVGIADLLCAASVLLTESALISLTTRAVLHGRGGDERQPGQPGKARDERPEGAGGG